MVTERAVVVGARIIVLSTVAASSSTSPAWPITCPMAAYPLPSMTASPTSGSGFQIWWSRNRRRFCRRRGWSRLDELPQNLPADALGDYRGARDVGLRHDHAFCAHRIGGLAVTDEAALSLNVAVDCIAVAGPPFWLCPNTMVSAVCIMLASSGAMGLEARSPETSKTSPYLIGSSSSCPAAPNCCCGCCSGLLGCP
ncbi:unnamed protein product [Linum trigynum]|uniref:Secreted protein n=1 Tax=Linum trigynum TaxID=586398 RepID=A0AAV2D2K9_9ROSI